MWIALAEVVCNFYSSRAPSLDLPHALKLSDIGPVVRGEIFHGLGRKRPVGNGAGLGFELNWREGAALAISKIRHLRKGHRKAVCFRESHKLRSQGGNYSFL